MTNVGLRNLIFGCASISSLKCLSECRKLLTVALDSGIRHFDTAQIYGKGYSELILGSFIRERRKEILISTKFGLGNSYSTFLPPRIALPLNFLRKKMKPEAAGSSLKTPEKIGLRIITEKSIKQDLSESLKRLKTDYLDYYLLHEGLPHFISESGLLFLNDIKKKGVVRNIGIAANRFNTSLIPGSTLNGWDVLQYDATPNQGKLDSLENNSLPIHFHHSVLKSFQQESGLDFLIPEEKPGYLLSKSVKNNPEGKVIFATRNIDRLKQNIHYFNHFTAQV